MTDETKKPEFEVTELTEDDLDNAAGGLSQGVLVDGCEGCDGCATCMN